MFRISARLGDEKPFKELIENARNPTDDRSQISSELRFRFFDRLATAKDLGDAIDGFPIAVLATPAEHKYLAHTAGNTFELRPIQMG